MADADESGWPAVGGQLGAGIGAATVLYLVHPWGNRASAPDHRSHSAGIGTVGGKALVFIIGFTAPVVGGGYAGAYGMSYLADRFNWNDEAGWGVSGGMLMGIAGASLGTGFAQRMGREGLSEVLPFTLTGASIGMPVGYLMFRAGARRRQAGGRMSSGAWIGLMVGTLASGAMGEKRAKDYITFMLSAGMLAGAIGGYALSSKTNSQSAGANEHKFQAFNGLIPLGISGVF